MLGFFIIKIFLLAIIIIVMVRTGFNTFSYFHGKSAKTMVKHDDVDDEVVEMVLYLSS